MLNFDLSLQFMLQKLIKVVEFIDKQKVPANVVCTAESPLLNLTNKYSL